MTDELKSIPTLLEEIEAAATEMQAMSMIAPRSRALLARIRGNVTEIELALVEEPEATECHHMTRQRVGGDATFTTWKCLIAGCGEEWTEARD